MTTTATPILDLVSLIEQATSVRLAKVANNHLHGTEYAGPCIFCGGNDRFHAFPESDSPKPHYFCRVCRKTGDHIDVLTNFRNMTYVEACQELGISPGETISSEAPMFFDEDPPSAKWQEMANLVVKSAETYLWAKAPHALEYLQKRGLTEETIRGARLGYIPLMPDGTWYTKPFESWGLTDEMLSIKQKEKGCVKVPPGILIPWFADGHLWKLAIKRFEAKEHEMKYGQVVGSRDALYNADTLARGKPVLLVEGELDALSVLQAARDLIAVVGTGSTVKARIPLWIARMASVASHTLVALDNDEAGTTASSFWLETLPNSMRWIPYAHDVNDMLKEGQNIRGWVQLGLKLSADHPLQGVEAEPEEKIVEIFRCSTCWRDLNDPEVNAFIDPEGEAFCETCWQKQQEAPAPEVVEPVETVEPEEILKIKKPATPRWLVPGTYDWDKQVARNGLKDMQQRRAEWLNNPV